MLIWHVAMVVVGGGILWLDFANMPLTFIEQIRYDLGPIAFWLLVLCGAVLSAICLFYRRPPVPFHQAIAKGFLFYCMVMLALGVIGRFDIVVSPFLSWIEIAVFGIGIILCGSEIKNLSKSGYTQKE